MYGIKKAGLRPAPLCLYHYMALLQYLLLRRKAECLRAQGKVFAGAGQSPGFSKIKKFAGVFAGSFSVKRN